VECATSARARAASCGGVVSADVLSFCSRLFFVPSLRFSATSFPRAVPTSARSIDPATSRPRAMPKREREREIETPTSARSLGPVLDRLPRGVFDGEILRRSISHWSPYDRVGVVNADP